MDSYKTIFFCFFLYFFFFFFNDTATTEIYTLSLHDALPIYTDFAKDFDRVPHQRLLIKMKMLDIIGKTLSWIEGFLSERQQCVRVQNDLSSLKRVNSGKMEEHTSELQSQFRISYAVFCLKKKKKKKK